MLCPTDFVILFKQENIYNMESIEVKVQQSLSELENKFEGSTHIEKYKEISKVFDSLVQSGLAQKRGYNLLSATDIHIMDRIHFNVPKSN